MLCCSFRSPALLGITLAMVALLATPQLRASEGSQVAVVDIGRLLKEHHRFQAAIDDLKKQRETDQVELKSDADNIDDLKRQLQQYEEESENYQQLAEKIEGAEAALAAKRLKFANEHERHEARIYFAFHHEVTTEIKHFAQRYGINLVVPFDSSEVNVDDSAEQILHRMKSGPLFQNNIDITDELFRRMGAQGTSCLPPNVHEPPSQR